MEFVRSFARIKDERLKGVLVSLVRAMADEEPENAETEPGNGVHEERAPIR